MERGFLVCNHFGAADANPRVSSCAMPRIDSFNAGSMSRLALEAGQLARFRGHARRAEKESVSTNLFFIPMATATMGSRKAEIAQCRSIYSSPRSQPSAETAGLRRF
jgi:hypothetical protein